MLDASLLLMPLVHFIAPSDPRWLSTLDAIGSDLVTDSLVHRYDPAAFPDGVDRDEGTFSMLSFWYVECLTRAGRLEQAQLAFEKMLTYANHLGLYSEQIGPSGELLGNFPQAFTHLGLISAAIAMAVRNHDVADGAIFHSDRGSNYTSAEFGRVLGELRIRQSVGRTGICYDNAMAESFFAALKNERVHRTQYPSRKHAMDDVARYIELRYNSQRLHSSLGYRTPAEARADMEGIGTRAAA